MKKLGLIILAVFLVLVIGIPMRFQQPTQTVQERLPSILVKDLSNNTTVSELSIPVVTMTNGGDKIAEIEVVDGIAQLGQMHPTPDAAIALDLSSLPKNYQVYLNAAAIALFDSNDPHAYLLSQHADHEALPFVESGDIKQEATESATGDLNDPVGQPGIKRIDYFLGLASQRPLESLEIRAAAKPNVNLIWDASAYFSESTSSRPSNFRSSTGTRPTNCGYGQGEVDRLRVDPSNRLGCPTGQVTIITNSGGMFCGSADCACFDKLEGSSCEDDSGDDDDGTDDDNCNGLPPGTTVATGFSCKLPDGSVSTDHIPVRYPNGTIACVKKDQACECLSQAEQKEWCSDDDGDDDDGNDDNWPPKGCESCPNRGCILDNKQGWGCWDRGDCQNKGGTEGQWCSKGARPPQCCTGDQYCIYPYCIDKENYRNCPLERICRGIGARPLCCPENMHCGAQGDELDGPACNCNEGFVKYTTGLGEYACCPEGQEIRDNPNHLPNGCRLSPQEPRW